jgi:hypothetical protein
MPGICSCMEHFPRSCNLPQMGHADSEMAYALARILSVARPDIVIVCRVASRQRKGEVRQPKLPRLLLAHRMPDTIGLARRSKCAL